MAGFAFFPFFGVVIFFFAQAPKGKRRKQANPKVTLIVN